ncbi:MAG: DUF4178 domain-containing protein [Gemmatimonadetes bacterium]|nr:DUF4178 domain-containing protein [Gemmatimonadota bacterium]
MSSVGASCPNCGAAIVFRWAQAVQATCDYCRSVLVRHDVALERVGESAIVPLTPSPLQLGTEGTWRGAGFTVIGRLVYAWERGGWSEWHLRLDRDESAWLSDAQAEYVVTSQVTPEAALPGAHGVAPGLALLHRHVRYEVTTVTRAQYVGTEGELPFASWDRAEVTFADLRSATGGFATIDYSEEPPLLFTGEAVELSQLALRNLRTFEGW